MLFSHTPTLRDSILDESTNLATDIVAFLTEVRDRVGADEAYALATRLLYVMDHVRQARVSLTSEKSRDHLAAARRGCLRALVALERLGARSLLPELQDGDLPKRLSRLASALEALSEPPPQYGSLS
ncbi:MAG: hypothetical protein ACYTDX_09645 [Planctomycetota bacterium]|jgi:hypothetical protein